MATYEKAKQPLHVLLEAVRAAHHAERLEGVTFAVLMVHAEVDSTGAPKGFALKHHGMPAAAKVRIVSLRDRAHGLADVEIQIDGDRWPKWSKATQRAILDHELTHLLRGKGEDDLGRPKLKIRDHDFQVGWFHEVAERHGKASVEVNQARVLATEYGKVYFGWSEYSEQAH